MTRDQHLEHLRQQQAKKLAEKLKQERERKANEAAMRHSEALRERKAAA